VRFIRYGDMNMEIKEYELLDGRTIRAKYDRLGMCKISEENLEAFTKEFNASYRQAKILEKIKENYALMKVDEHKKGYWIVEDIEPGRIWKCHCSNCGKDPQEYISGTENWWLSSLPKYCPTCGTEMKMKTEIIMSSEDV
jgi:hypothetical protein